MKKHKLWTPVYEKARVHLNDRGHWLPWPVFIPAVITLLLISQLIPLMNPRIGHPVNQDAIAGIPLNGFTIWLGISLDGDKVIVSTEDRQVFEWSEKIDSTEATKPLVEYLKKRVREITVDSALFGKSFRSQTRVILATDIETKFFHIRPVLYALAQARVTSYAFETSNSTKRSKDNG